MLVSNFSNGKMKQEWRGFFKPSLSLGESDSEQFYQYELLMRLSLQIPSSFFPGETFFSHPKPYEMGQSTIT